MRRIVLFLMAGLLAACGAQDEQPPVSAAPPCTLTVGWDPWEPYQFATVDGSVAGLDVEIATLLAGDIGCELRYRRGEWGELLAELREGRVDMLLAATPVAERKAFAHFSAPYRRERFVVYTRPELEGRLRGKTLEEIAAEGLRIGITSGYYYGEAVSKLAFESEFSDRFLSAPVPDLNYWRLLDGTVDAIIADPVALSAFVRRKGFEGRFVRLPIEVSSGDVALMFSRASVDEALVRRFDEALVRRKANGSITRIIDRYGG